MCGPAMSSLLWQAAEGFIIANGTGKMKLAVQGLLQLPGCLAAVLTRYIHAT